MNPGKRAFDFSASLAGLIALAPLFALIALAIKLEDHGPILFRQRRVGRFGRTFGMLKFRTMTAGTGSRGPLITVAGDPRVTRTGRFLRGTKLDELPQLFNVLRGDMSLVGPRPEVEKYVELYNPDQRRVLELVPGITDPASIAYRREEDLLAGFADPERAYVEKIMPEKIRLNLEYAASGNMVSDLVVIWRTLFGSRRPR